MLKVTLKGLKNSKQKYDTYIKVANKSIFIKSTEFFRTVDREVIVNNFYIYVTKLQDMSLEIFKEFQISLGQGKEKPRE